MNLPAEATFNYGWDIFLLKPQPPCLPGGNLAVFSLGTEGSP